MFESCPGKTLYSHSVFILPSVQIGTGKFNAGGNDELAFHPGGSRNVPSPFLLKIKFLYIVGGCGSVTR